MNIRRLFSSLDWITFAPVAALLIISLVTLYSLDVGSFKSQAIFAAFSLLIFFIVLNLNPNTIKHYAKPIYLVSIFIFALVLIIGVESRGSVRWVEILGVRVQFSEVLKPFLAISFAAFLADLKGFSLRNFVISLGYLLPIFVLIFLQPDLGNALIYAGVLGIALLIWGFPFKYFIGSFIIWLLSLPILWTFLHDYQRDRLLTFIFPSRDPLGTSYNAIQSVIAVGSGMVIGKGLGQGTQAGLRFLPEHHTDFIFASISEDLGLLGSGVVIFCFAFLLYRIYLMFLSADDKFSKAFSLIVFLTIFVHFFMNVGMNLGIVPIVGITLPYVSAGGSSLLSNFIMLGLLFAISGGAKKRKVLEIG